MTSNQLYVGTELEILIWGDQITYSYIQTYIYIIAYIDAYMCVYIYIQVKNTFKVLSPLNITYSQHSFFHLTFSDKIKYWQTNWNLKTTMKELVPNKIK